MGLRVGHDTLFLRHIESPVTIFPVKDPLTGLQPLKALEQLRGK